MRTLKYAVRQVPILKYFGMLCHFVDGETSFRKGDEIVILTHSETLPDLKKRWDPKNAGRDE